MIVITVQIHKGGGQFRTFIVQNKIQDRLGEELSCVQQVCNSLVCFLPGDIGTISFTCT